MQSRQAPPRPDLVPVPDDSPTGQDGRYGGPPTGQDGRYGGSPTGQDGRYKEALYIGVRGWRRRRMSAGVEKGLFEVLAQFPPLRWYAKHVAPRHLRRERVEVPVQGLPPGLAGLRIG